MFSLPIKKHNLINFAKMSHKPLFSVPKFVASRLDSKSLKERNSSSQNLTRNVKNASIEVIHEHPYTMGDEEEDYPEENNDINEVQNDKREYRQSFKSPTNIFFAKKNIPNFVEHNLGPRYDIDGKLLKRSIIGKTESFSKFQNMGFKNQENNLLFRSIERKISFKGAVIKGEKVREKDSNRSRSSSVASRDEDNNDIKKRKQSNISVGNISFRKIPEATGKYNSLIRIPKEELLNDIKESENRRIKNAFSDKELLSTLPTQDQRFLTKEQRIVDKFMKTQDLWEHKADLISNKLKRKKENALFCKLDDYRLKVENAATLDLLKNDDEKYGNKYWYLTLREYPTDARKETETLFKKSKMNFTRNNLEAVRKINTANCETREENRRKHLEKNEYLQERLQMNAKKLNVIKPYDENNLAELKV